MIDREDWSGVGRAGRTWATARRAHHIGWSLSIPELISAYLARDVLVHPSAAGPHPLAIAEAVYTAPQVVLSDRVGSWGPTDDVRPCNGLRYRYGDVEGLGRHLAAVVGDDALRGRLAAASARIGRCRSSAESVHTHVQAVQETPPPPEDSVRSMTLAPLPGGRACSHATTQ